MLKINSYIIKPLLYEVCGNTYTKQLEISNIDFSQDEINFLENLKEYLLTKCDNFFPYEKNFKIFIDLRANKIAKIYFYPIAKGIFYVGNFREKIELAPNHQKKEIKLTLEELSKINHSAAAV